MTDVCTSTSIWLAFALVAMGLTIASFVPFILQEYMKIENYLKLIFVIINAFAFAFLLVAICVWRYLGHSTIISLFT